MISFRIVIIVNVRFARKNTQWRRCVDRGGEGGGRRRNKRRSKGRRMWIDEKEWTDRRKGKSKWGSEQQARRRNTRTGQREEKKNAVCCRALNSAPKSKRDRRMAMATADWALAAQEGSLLCTAQSIQTFFSSYFFSLFIPFPSLFLHFSLHHSVFSTPTNAPPPWQPVDSSALQEGASIPPPPLFLVVDN